MLSPYKCATQVKPPFSFCPATKKAVRIYHKKAAAELTAAAWFSKKPWALVFY